MKERWGCQFILASLTNDLNAKNLKLSGINLKNGVLLGIKKTMENQEYYEITLKIHRNVFKEMSSMATISGLTQEGGKGTEIINKIVDTIKNGEKEITLINKKDVKND